MIGLDVRSNAEKAIAEIDALDRREKRTALARALNRAAGGVRTDASAEIRKTYRVKKATVDRAFSTTRAAAAKLVALVRVRGRPLNIAGFGARQTRRGVSVDVKGSRKVIAGAFLRELTSRGGDDYRVVFRRLGKSRLPIQAIKTVDVPGLFSLEDVQRVVDQKAASRFEVEARRQLAYILGLRHGR